MGIEIERKFLVTSNEWQLAPSIAIRQAYLCRDPERTIRVRITEGRALLTIKGRAEGFARPEFEYEIPLSDGEALFSLSLPVPIQKRRYLVPFAGKIWEVDCFEGAHQGLVVAELELSSVEETFLPPPWLGLEVSEDHRYTNSYLSKHPYLS
jgi:adenylate cyclase